VRSEDGSVVLRPPGEARPPGASFSSHLVGDVHIFVASPAGTGPFPTVFQIHGGPAAQDTDAYRASTQAFVDHGFAVVMINCRGSAGYGRDWRDTLVGNPGFLELEDIAAVRAWTIDQRIADPSRVVLHGGSWGGYLTLLGLVRQPALWTAGVAVVPIADWTANYEDSAPMLQAYGRTLFAGSPVENPALYADRSPITYVSSIQAPVLVMVGENDPRCPIRQARMFIDRLEELGKAYQAYFFDAGHGSMVVEEQIRMTETMLHFLAKHLGTPEPL
jgi:dipeptidyl aminopeptidase/acylaminoacyl peptidase